MKAKLFFFGTLAALGVPAGAQSTWLGTTSNSWGTAANWNPAEVPADGTDIVIANATGSSNVLNLDTSHTIGGLIFGDGGTRVSPQFNLNTQAANNLTITGGVVANGAFGANSSQSLLMRGHYTVATDQMWIVGGSAAHNTDQGVFVREAATGVTNRGSLTLHGNLTKTGTGQLSFAAIDVSGGGNIIVESGDLKFNAGASQPLVVGGPGSIVMNNASVLAVYKNSGTMNITRPIELNGTSTLVARNSAVVVDSPIAFNGVHTLDAGGTTNLNGAWTGFGMVNRIGAGTLSLNGDLSGFLGVLNINSSAQTNVTNVIGALGGSLAVNLGTVSLGGAVAGDLTLGAGATISGEVAAGGNLTLNGGTFSVDPTTPTSLGTLAGLSLSGTNTVALSASPTSTAPFTVLSYGGSLGGGAANLSLLGGATNYRSPVFSDTTPGIITLSVGSEARTWNGGAAWDINTSANWLEGDQKFYQLDRVTFGDTGAGSIALTGVLTPSSIAVNGSADYTFTAAAGNLIAGSATLAKSGSGTLTLGGANTFTGGVVIDGGVLKVTTNQALGANGNAITVAAGATLDTNGAMNANRDYRAVIAGSGVDGNGAIVNSTATDRTNGFRSIALSADATIGGSARFDVRPITAGTALVDLAGFTLTKAGTNKIALVDGVMSNPGTIEINGGTLALTRMAVSGGGSINVNAGSTLQFENNATGSFSKELKVDGGLVLVTGNGFRVDGGVVLSNTATFQTDVALTVGGAVSGSGSLVKTGAGTLILEGESSHGGGTTVTAGTLQLGNGGTTGSVAGDIANEGAVAFNRSDDSSYGGAISGIGTVTKSGAGTLVLSGTSSYTGATTVTAGTLLVNGALGTTPVALAGGATLGGGGSIGGAVTTRAPSAVIAPGSSPGVFTVGALDVTNGGTFDFELGTVADRLDITGILTAAAAVLDFRFTDSGGIAGATPYTLFTFSSQSGLDYADLNASVLPGALTLDPGFGTGGWLLNSGSLQVQFIPEPSAIILLAAGAFGIALRRRT